MPLPKEVKDDLPDDVVEEVEAIEAAGEGEEGEKTEPPAQFRLSRRKKEQQEREGREADLAARAAESDRLRSELQRQGEETARLRGAMEQMNAFQARQQAQPAQRQGADDEGDSLPEKIAARLKKADTALKGSDLDEYHAQMRQVMRLEAQAIVAAQPRPAAPQQQAPQKPAWVTAIEFQYPDVLSHPRGQPTVGAVDSLLTTMGEQWGPDRLHKAFQRARAELGLKVAAAPTTQQRQLHSGISSGGLGPNRSGGDRTVNIPREYLAVAAKSGMSKKEAVKAYMETYPEEN